MNTHDRSATGGFRRPLFWCAIGGLSALAFWYFDGPAQQPAAPLSQDIPRVGDFGERPQVAPISTRSAARLDGAIDTEASRRAAEPAYFARPSSQQPQLPQFKFLGKITEAGETLVLLYGGGRMLTVRGIGPLDDDYVVDAIQEGDEEGYVVLRHVFLGESQIIQLALLDPKAETGGSAENYPQD